MSTKGRSLPLVSIVTIFHDPPLHFFEEAIASVMAQTERRWELLLVDDGSSGESAVLARRHAAARPGRIRLLSHPGGANLGTGASRDLGVQAASGTYVAFLDADDVFLPQKLERKVALLEAHPRAAMVFGPTPHWHGWTGRPEDSARDTVRRLGVPAETLVEPPELVRAFLGRRADTPATCGVLVRRSAIAAVGGFEAEFPDLNEDQAFFYKLCLGHPVYVEGTAWDRYRRHPHAMCEVMIRAGIHSDDYSPTAARGRFLSWLEGYFERTAVKDPGLWRLLRREMAPFRHPRRHRVMSAGREAARAVLPVALRRAARRLLEAVRLQPH
jgi:glycosyltransferase involved in cell wall biosynthesis